MKFYQQGDVILIPVQSVKGSKRNNHLAEGEATGHYHGAQGEGVSVLEDDGTRYLDAPNGATVDHQEHKTISVPPGKYQVRIVREFDHLEEIEREVRD